MVTIEYVWFHVCVLVCVILKVTQICQKGKCLSSVCDYLLIEMHQVGRAAGLEILLAGLSSTHKSKRFNLWFQYCFNLIENGTDNYRMKKIKMKGRLYSM